ncbi:hypothetical protein H4R23_006078, partial [Coemansia sp. Cherry 401B]
RRLAHAAAAGSGAAAGAIRDAGARRNGHSDQDCDYQQHAIPAGCGAVQQHCCAVEPDGVVL